MVLSWLNYQKDTDQVPLVSGGYNPPPIVDPNWDQGAPSAPAASAALAGDLPDSTPVVPVGRDAQADPEPPAVDPTVLAGLRNESTPAEPAADAGFSPELKRIKDAHDAHLLAKHLPADVPYAGEMAPDNPNTPTVVYAHGRPDSVYGGDEAANQAAMAKAVRDYQPQKAKGFVNRYLKPIAMGALAGGRTGSPFGMIGGAISGGITGAVKPELANERWKAGKQAEIADQQAAATKEAQAQAQIAHTRAETRKLNAPGATVQWQIVKSKGHYVPIDRATGKDPQGNLVEYPEAAGDEWQLHVNAAGDLIPVNKHTGRDQNGNVVNVTSKVQQPDGTFVTADTIFAKEGRQGDQDRSLSIDNQKAAAENARIDKEIALKNADKKTAYEDRTRVEKGMGQWIITKSDVYGEQKHLNPEWERADTQFRKLSDEIQKLEAGKKTIVKAPPRPTVTSGRSKVPAKTSNVNQLKNLGIL